LELVIGELHAKTSKVYLLDWRKRHNHDVIMIFRKNLFDVAFKDVQVQGLKYSEFNKRYAIKIPQVNPEAMFPICEESLQSFRSGRKDHVTIIAKNNRIYLYLNNFILYVESPQFPVEHYKTTLVGKEINSVARYISSYHSLETLQDCEMTFNPGFDGIQIRLRTLSSIINFNLSMSASWKSVYMYDEYRYPTVNKYIIVKT
jgi:hypothetical protein